MADFQSEINVNIDTSQALASIKNLQRQIANFHSSIIKGNAQASAASRNLQQNLINSINSTGQFSASMRKVTTTTESFTNALEKNKLGLGETFRYGMASTKRFGSFFNKEMGVIDKTARERVKTLQTQYIKMGRDANGAMQSIAVRPLKLDMENLATQTAVNAQKQQIFNKLLQQGSTNLLNWGKNTQWAGRQLMVGFTIPLTIFGVQAAKAFQDLEEQTIKFKRVYGDLFTTNVDTEKALKDVRGLADEFTKFGIAVEDTVGLAASVAQIGNTGAQLRAQVREATRLSVLGGMEQQQALDTTISLTNAFGVSAENLTEKVNFLNAAENQTILSIQDFTEAVPKAGSVVKQLGGDVEDLALFLTAMREGGVNASQSANALKSSLARLINPTDVAVQKLGAFGIDILGIVNNNAGDLTGTVMALAESLDTLNPLDKARAIEQLFGKFQFARMSTLMNNIIEEGSQASQVLDLMSMSAEDLGNIATRELGRVEESAATKFRKSLEQLNSALAPIGEQFLKAVTPILEFATKFLEQFDKMSDGMKNFTVITTAVLGAVAPVALMVIGLIGNGVANLMKFVAFIRSGFLKAGKSTNVLGNQLNYMTQEQLESLSVSASLEQSHNRLTQAFSSEKAALDNLTNSYTQAIVAAKRFATANPGLIRPTQGGQKLAAGTDNVKKYNQGVFSVPGPKGAGDIVPAMLSPGEAVIPAKEADKYRGLIKEMIDGKIPGYRFGAFNIASMMGRSRVATRMPSQSFIGSLRSKDLSYKSGFATGTGADFTDRLGRPMKQHQLMRRQAEKNLYGTPTGSNDPAMRPVYGSVASSPLQRIFNMIFGGRKGRQFNQVTNPMASNLDQYGDISLIGRQSMNRRASTFVGDTLLKYSKNPAWVKGTAPMRGSTAEQRKTAGFDAFDTPFGATKDAKGGVRQNPAPSYIEAQTMGGFQYKEIDKIIARDPRLRKQLKAELRQAGIRGVKVRGEGFVASLMSKLGFPGFNQGAFSVPGSGNGDTVPAMLTPGEAVIPKESAGKYRGLIKSIIADDVPGFNNGTSKVPMFGEYAVRLQEKTENMQKRSGRVNDPNQILAPLSMRIGESRGIAPTRNSVAAGKLDPIAKEYEQIVTKFTDRLNIEFETTYRNIKDTNERFRKSWQAAGKSVEKDVNKIKSKSERGIVRKTFGLSPDTMGTIPTEPRRKGGNSLDRARKSAFTTGPKSYAYVGAGARQLFERRTGTPGSNYQMGHVNKPKLAFLKTIVDSPNASNAAKQAAKVVGEQADVTKKDVDATKKKTEATKKKTQETKKSIKATQQETQATKRKTTAYRDPVTGRFAKRPQPSQTAAPVVNAAQTQKTGGMMSALGGSAMAASFALSSLAGAGSMMGGAIGEVSGKLFMISSVATSLIFVIQALTQAKVAELAKTRLATAQAAVSRSVVTGGMAARGGISGILGKLVVGITKFLGPIGIATTAVALFGGAIKLAMDQREEERKRIEGLGKAANLSTEQLEKLGELLNTRVRTVDYESAAEMPTEGASGEELRSAREVLADANFQEMFEDEIAGIEAATEEQAERALNALAFQLKASGFEVDAVNAIIRAIATEAGKTNIQLKFAEIDVSTVEGQDALSDLVKESAQALEELAESDVSSEFERTKDDLLDTTKAQAEETAGVYKSAIDAIKLGLEDGEVGAEEFNSVMEDLFGNIQGGPAGALMVQNLAEQMGIQDSISQIQDLDDKVVAIQAAAAGVPIDIEKIVELQQFSNDADVRAQNQKALNEMFKEYNDQIEEYAENQERANDQKAASDELDDKRDAFDVRVQAIQDETEAIRQQSDAYDFLIDLGWSTEDALQAVADANFMAAFSNKVDAAAARDAADAYLEKLNAAKASSFEQAKERSSGGAAQKSPFQQATEDLKQQRNEIRNSLNTYNRLRDAGFSISDAFNAAQDSTIAAAVATTKVGTSSWNNLLNLIQNVNRELAEGEIKNLLIEGIADITLKENFTEIVPLLSDMGLELEDIQNILDNPVIAQALIDDLKDGSLEAENLKAFIDQIPKQKEVDILFNLSTEEGVMNQFDEMMSRAMDIFNFEEAVVRDKYEEAIDAQEDIIENAQDSIEDLQDNIAKRQREIELQYTRPIEQLQEEATILSNDLALMDNAAEKINEKYDKRIKALADVEELNSKIADSQRKQLSLADALSQGDISAAAGIMQEMRAQSAQEAAAGLQDALGASRDAEIDNLRSASGMTRDQIAERQFNIQQEIFDLEQQQKPLLEDIENLEDQIFDIQNGRLKTAQDTLETIKDQEQAELDAIDAKREAWEDAKLAQQEAKFAGEEYNDVLELTEDLVAGILKDWDAIKSKVVTLTIKKVTTGGGGGGSFDTGSDSSTEYSTGNGGNGDGNGGDPDTKDEEDPAPPYIPGGWREPDESIIDGRIVGGSGSPAGETNTGLISDRDDSRFNRFMASGGKVKPTSKKPDMFQAVNTDTVPAMLTPGEYVIKRSSARELGSELLDKINSGEITSKDFTQFLFSGGIVRDFVSRKYFNPQTTYAPGGFRKPGESIINGKSVGGSGSPAGETQREGLGAKPDETVINGKVVGGSGSPAGETQREGLGAKPDETVINGKVVGGSGSPAGGSPQPTYNSGGSTDKKEDKNKESGGFFQGIVSGFENTMQKIGENPVVKKIGEAYTADNLGGKIFRGVTGALSAPGEIIGAAVNNAVNDAVKISEQLNSGNGLGAAGTIISSTVGAPFRAATEGINTAFSGVMDASEQKDSNFNRATQTMIENEMFGTEDAEQAALAQIIGGVMNVAADPLSYVGIGLATKGVKGISAATKAANKQKALDNKHFIDIGNNSTDPRIADVTKPFTVSTNRTGLDWETNQPYIDTKSLTSQRIRESSSGNPLFNSFAQEMITMSQKTGTPLRNILENSRFEDMPNVSNAQQRKILNDVLNDPEIAKQTALRGGGLEALETTKKALRPSILYNVDARMNQFFDKVLQSDMIAKNFPSVTGAILNNRAKNVKSTKDLESFLKGKGVAPDETQALKYEKFLESVRTDPKNTRLVIAAESEAAKNILKTRTFRPQGKDIGRSGRENQFLGTGEVSDYAQPAYGALYNKDLVSLHKGFSTLASDGYGNIKMILPDSVSRRTRVFGGDSILQDASYTQSLNRVLKGKEEDIAGLFTPELGAKRYIEAQILGGLPRLPRKTRYTLNKNNVTFSDKTDLTRAEYTRQGLFGEGNATSLIRDLIRFTGDDPQLLKKFRFADMMDVSDSRQMTEFKNIIKEVDELEKSGTGKIKIPEYETFKKLVQENQGGLQRVLPKVLATNKAMGGRVDAYRPMGSDSVPSMLTPGEFVMNRRSTKKFLPLLKSMNSNFKIPSSMSSPSFAVPQTATAAGVNKVTDQSANTSETVYNYNLNLSVSGGGQADPQALANTVISRIKEMDSQRIRRRVV